MSSGKDQLRQAQESVKNSENLTENEKTLIVHDFIHELRNGENIQSDYTFAKHVRKLKNIAEYNTWNLAELEPTREISKEIRNQIQVSAYKSKTEENSQYSEKNKKDHWTTWKYFLKHVHNISNPKRSDYLPPASFSSNKDDVDKQVTTNPKDLPNPRQFRKLLKTFRQQGKDKVADRNVAFFMFLWDTGARAGEALDVQMKHVEIRDGNLYIDEIKGNKGSDDRINRIWQGEKLLKNYYTNHPARDNPEAYLFPKTYYNEWTETVGSSQLADVMRAAKASASLEFNDYGEPLHIFRKAMSTFLVVNDIMDWETVCSRQGKKEDSTKPDYILRAEEDRELIEAKGFGLEEDQENEDGEKKGHMIGDPLMPQNCQSCDRVNNCLQDLCVECGGELQYSTLPKNKVEADPEDVMRENLTEEKVDELMRDIQRLKDAGLVE